MRQVNLVSFFEAQRDLSENVFKEYLKLYQVEMKNKEINDMSNFIRELISNITKVEDVMSILDGYYMGYTINQISKEFDILRLGRNYTVNIEIKNKSTCKKIKKQLIENRYYLSILDCPIYSFTYTSEDNALYMLNTEEELIETNFTELKQLLNNQEVRKVKNLHDIFKPTNYLISPFNTTEKFIEGKYFLTNHQKELKKQMFDKDEIKDKYTFLEGAAGTGKTLFTYDIAKEYINNSKNVLIIHCGILNSGHEKLINDFGWNIKPIRNAYGECFESYDLIVFDETQRIWARGRDQLLNKIKASEARYIFSFDREQYLGDFELTSDTISYFEEQLTPKHIKLTEKVRTNKEIAGFIKNLFDLSKVNNDISYSNINIKYFSNPREAKIYMNELSLNGWEVINFTPSSKVRYPYEDLSYPSDKNAHKVIGQEFDNVVAVIDRHFYYSEDHNIQSGIMTKKLAIRKYCGKSYYYNPVKMLFQIMTRTRKRLTLLIINNEEILKECIKIVNP